MNEFERSVLVEKVGESILEDIYKKLEKFSGSKKIEYDKISLIMLKPGFVSDETKQITEERFNQSGLKILSQSDIIYNKPTTDLHYLDLIHKGFFESELKPYFVGGPCYAYLVYGENAIEKGREIACGKGGTTKDVKPDGIRYIIPKMLGEEMDLTRNVVHATGDVKDCRGEITCFVKNSVDYFMLKIAYAQAHKVPLEKVDANDVYKKLAEVKVQKQEAQKPAGKNDGKSKND